VNIADQRFANRWIGFAWAMAALAAALLLRWLLDPLMGNTLPLVTLFAAVAAAVWVSGVGAAVVTLAIGYLASNYLFIEPRGELSLGKTDIVVGLLAYLFTCTLIIAFGGAARHAQARASAGREVMRVTLRSIGDAVITTDNDGCITYMNEVAEAVTAWSLGEARGQPLDRVFRIVNESTRQPVESPATRALRQGVIVGLANHTLLLRKDGTECPIDDSAAPIRDERGAVSGCVLIFRDVTAQRRHEHEQADQLMTARLLAAIVESSDDAIVSKSLDGTIRSWNLGAERLFGHSAAHAIGRHISLISPPERLSEEDRIIERLKAGERIDHFETERLAADGRRLVVSLSISPIKNGAGEVIGASKVARDVTHQRQTEAQLRRLAEDLAEADRRKDEFLATLAHELRNPLAPLSNALAVMKRAGDDPAVVLRARDTMERQLAQLVRLVDDLLDLNRITHNRLDLRKQPVDLASVLQQALEASRPLAEAARHTLHVTLPDEAVYVHADPARLAQVFGNLLNNSSKYTRPGGVIDLVVQREGAQVSVSIKDSGIGIPPDQLERIFEMFAQVEHVDHAAGGGLGIGLTLVKRLLQMHGGSIEARSDGEGHGSEFIVRLPTIDAPAQVAQPTAAPTEEPTEVLAQRVLVVDDNADSAESLAMLLQMWGHEVFTAHDGEAAIHAADAHRPEVVLLDIGLPKINGHDVCRHIRAQPWGRDIMLVALTGWGQDNDRRRSHEAGFDGHLVKPVGPDALLALLTSRIATRGAR
jgi:PAS domain S-box-containing protein